MSTDNKSLWKTFEINAYRCGEMSRFLGTGYKIAFAWFILVISRFFFIHDVGGILWLTLFMAVVFSMPFWNIIFSRYCCTADLDKKKIYLTAKMNLKPFLGVSFDEITKISVRKVFVKVKLSDASSYKRMPQAAYYNKGNYDVYFFETEKDKYGFGLWLYNGKQSSELEKFITDALAEAGRSDVSFSRDDTLINYDDLCKEYNEYYLANK